MSLNDYLDLEAEAKTYTSCGGEWLAASRTYMQHHSFNGDTVIWNSDVDMKPPVTAHYLEEFARVVAEATYKDLKRKWGK
jgi:hypothetical protein